MFKAASLLSATALLVDNASAIKLTTCAKSKAEHGDHIIFDLIELGEELGYTAEMLEHEYDTLFAEPVDYDAIRATSLADSSDFMIAMELAFRLGYHPEEIADAYDALVYGDHEDC